MSGLDNLIEMIKDVQEEARKSFSLVRLEVDALIREDVSDEKVIEALLDTVMDYVFLGIGELEYLKLVDYYRNFNPEGADFYQELFYNLFEQEE